MTENSATTPPESGAASKSSDEEAEASVPSALGAGLAAAAKKSGLGHLAETETPTGQALLGAIGGVRGLAETILPGLIFLVVYTFTFNVPLSLGASVAVAIVFTVIRLVGRTPLTQAVAGLIGVGASAILALLTGRGADNFVLGLVTNGAYATALLVSILVGWPLIGLAAGYLMGDGLAWRKDRSKFRVMQLLTFFWFALFAVRLVVQLPLYFADSVQGLAITKLLMGVPLYVPLLLVSWFIVRSVFGAQKASAAKA